ncbi:MAG: hypothetical protein ACC682_11340, partial [Gemmatimonadota bacterium]
MKFLHSRWVFFASFVALTGLVGCSSSTEPPPPPPPPPDPPVFTVLEAGGGHTCGINQRGTFCWGKGDAGQVGDGSSTDRNAPTRVVTTVDLVSLD